MIVLHFSIPTRIACMNKGKDTTYPQNQSGLTKDKKFQLATSVLKCNIYVTCGGYTLYMKLSGIENVTYMTCSRYTCNCNCQVLKMSHT